MTQEIRVVYKNTDKSVVGFIDAQITYEEEIKPALEKDGVLITEETLIFEDEVEITNDMLEVNSKGIPVLTKAFQEQQTIIDDLKTRIETLENA